jgi:CBS domain-containing protein
MITVKKLLAQKGNAIYSVTPETRVLQALKLMAEHDIGALLVMENDQLLGIFSERDYARKVILKGRSSKETQVKDIMTPKVLCIRPQQSLSECMAVMSRNRIRYLPVVEREHVVGFISIGDVVSAIIADQENALQRLEQVVLGAKDDIMETP